MLIFCESRSLKQPYTYNWGIFFSLWGICITIQTDYICTQLTPHYAAIRILPSKHSCYWH
jgi:hypothetical protein